jgi:hypothetical protein
MSWRPRYKRGQVVCFNGKEFLKITSVRRVKNYEGGWRYGLGAFGCSHKLLRRQTKRERGDA